VWCRGPRYEWAQSVEERDAIVAEVVKHWGSGSPEQPWGVFAGQDEQARRLLARHQRLAMTPDAVAASLAMVGKLDVRRALAGVQCPTLVLRRADDTFFDARHSRYTAEHIPNAQLVETGPDDRAADEIERFLTGVRRPIVSDRVLGRARARRTFGGPAPSREPFEDYVACWLIGYRGRTSRGLVPSTREAYAWTMRTYVVPYFRGTRDRRRRARRRQAVRRSPRQPGAAPVPERRDVSRELDDPRDHDAAEGDARTPLKAMLAESYELEILATDAARVRVVVRGRAPAHAPETMTREQLAALMEFLDSRDRLLVLLLRWTGLRIAEALGLRSEDLCDLGNGPVLLVRSGRQRAPGRPSASWPTTSPAC
jgi:hypothetical protein